MYGSEYRPSLFLTRTRILPFIHQKNIAIVVTTAALGIWKLFNKVVQNTSVIQRGQVLSVQRKPSLHIASSFSTTHGYYNVFFYEAGGAKAPTTHGYYNVPPLVGVQTPNSTVSI